MLEKQIRTIVFLLIFYLFGINANFAQEVKSTQDSDIQIGLETDNSLRFIPKADVKSQDGSVGIVESSLDYSYGFKLFDQLPIKVGIESKYVGIENTSSVELPSNLTYLGSSFEVTGPFFNIENAYLRAEFCPSLFGSNWNFRSSGFRMHMYYYGIYKPNEQWTYIAGVAVMTDFDSQILPILGFIYKPNEKLTFRIVPKDPGIFYKVNDKLTAFLEGDLGYCEYEVDRNNEKNVVLKYSENVVGLGVKYNISSSLGVSLSAGEVFNRQLKYLDGNGKVNIKNSPYISAKIDFKI